MPKRSPLAPDRFPDLPPLDGVRLAAGAFTVRYADRDDVLLVELARGTTVAGVFTRSLTAAAPVDWCRAAAPRGRARALLVNAGNANAFTGRAGVGAVRETVDAVAGRLGCARKDIFVASTGVIGEKLPMDRIHAAIDSLSQSVAQPGAETGWPRAAGAIMTTDTFAKGATASAEIDGVAVTINGIAKGSGMIAPNMATMLAFVFTDAGLPAPVLDKLLRRANAGSFNAITVDGDTSTSDTVLLFATGQARHRRIAAPGDRALGDFRAALQAVMTDLAHQIVRDGEGAGKFVEVTVTGAASSRAARTIAFSIANSPLVKTAIAGADANWGRIVMAVGKAGQRIDRDRLVVRIGGTPITGEGMVRADYEESPVARHMTGRDIVIEVDVGIGRGRATVWTCDLTHGYIDINADYRT